MQNSKKKIQIKSPQSAELVSAKPNGPFKALGLQGLNGLAPVLVAALATEEPPLLIGPHGSAKTLLLTRVAAALGLPPGTATRTYSTSMILSVSHCRAHADIWLPVYESMPPA